MRNYHIVLWTSLKKIAFFLTTASLVGCQTLGPHAISYGRVSYNQAIQETSNQEVFMNLMRVRNNEPALFMNVTEVDASQQIQGSLTAAAQNIGGTRTSPETHSGGATFAYSETPLVRYVPLLGQSLVAQLATPVDVESIAALSDSLWPMSSVLSFTVNYLTPSYGDKDAALNALLRLDYEGVLTISAGRSYVPTSNDGQRQQAKQAAASADKASSPSDKSSSRSDALVLYFEPDHPYSSTNLPAPVDELQSLLKLQKTNWLLWLRLVGIYCNNEPREESALLPSCSNSDVSELAKRISNATSVDEINKLNIRRWIEIRTSPLSPRESDFVPDLSPMMRTRSAMGILKAMNESPYAEVVSKEAYSLIRGTPWNDSSASDFYTLLPYIASICPPEGADSKSVEQSGLCEVRLTKVGNGDESGEITNPATVKALRTVLSEWGRVYSGMANLKPDLILSYSADSNTKYFRQERVLAHLRRYILIVKDDHRPENSFVEYEDRGNWYYIDKDDAVSKKNFSLLSAILTMMAVPPQNLPLIPTFTVGG